MTSRAASVSHRKLVLILIGLMAGLFLGALDTMIMATALRTIADRLDGLTMQAWVTTAYLVTMTVSAPLYGKLSDRFGRRPLYLVAIGLFLVGSVLCAIAGSIETLSAARAVQGLGAGGLASLALAVVADIAPDDKRSTYQANLGVVFALASVSGPVLGGFLAGQDTMLGVDGWRWIFLINLPIGLIALVTVAALLDLPPSGLHRRIDLLGSVLLLLALFPLLVVAEQGRTWGWGSVASLSMIALGVAGVLLFLAVEHRVGDDALIPARLFRRPSFAMVNMVNFLGGIGVFAGLALLPLYLQIVQGLSPTQAGLLLLPQSLATTLGARNADLLVAALGYRRALAAGMLLMTAVFTGLSFVGTGTPLWVIALLVIGHGAGMGVFFQVTLTAMQRNVPTSDIGLASGLYNFSRQIGGVAGTAVFVSVLFGIATDRILARFGESARTEELAGALADRAVTAAPANARLLSDVAASRVNLDDTSFLSVVDARLARPVLEGFSSSLNSVFLIVAGFLLVSVLLALGLREDTPAGTE